MSQSPFISCTGDMSLNPYRCLVSEGWIEQMILEWEGKPYNNYKNLYVAFTHKLYYDYHDINNYWESENSYVDFVHKLNDIQKMFLAMVPFEAQTNNGGVYQFFFNVPEYSIVALEAMQKANLDRLSNDYEIALNQFYGKFESIAELRSKFQMADTDWESRWASFTEGYKEVPQGKIIEKYFYDNNYLAGYHSKLAKFVIDNKDYLVRTS